MHPAWRRYLAEQRRYVPYLVWSLVATLAFSYALGGAASLPGGLARGLVIGLSILLTFAGAYAAFVVRYLRTGRRVPESPWLRFSLGAFGLACGLWITSTGRGRMPVGAGLLVAALLIGVFFFHDESRRQREQALAARAALAEARLHALEREMRPHFLFNALNGLAELVESGRPEAAGMAHALADLYRRLLQASGTRTMPLSDELAIVSRYLELEAIRFPDRLRSSLAVPRELLATHVPSLILQTLVENAVKHGIAPSVDGGEVRVEAAREPYGLVRLTVTNTGAPFDASRPGGTGLPNSRERLGLLYGERHRFTLRGEPGRTVATFLVTGEPA